MHHPIKWDELMSSSEPRTVADPKKISYINNLPPFMHKKAEFLVIVTIRKNSNSWWYNACNKCFKTADRNGDSYRCSDNGCSFIGTPTQRYKLFVHAGDETCNADFILFGHMVQHLTKKPIDALIAENPLGFISDEVIVGDRWPASLLDTRVKLGS
uniref:Replication factor A C-terminal domain-containing protein n=1 Tax=Arundo donax TaxID=35708 RepID=A0A0A9G208_ARUDO